MGNIYTTKQLEDITGVPSATLRSWKQRGKLAEGIHWAKDEQDNLVWTDAGLEAVRALSGQSGDTALPKNAGTATDSDATATGADVIQQFADQVAWGVIEHQLPGAVQGSITRILSNPTEADRDRLLQILERVGSGVTLARMSAIFAGGLGTAIAASRDSLQLPGGRANEAP